MIVPDYVSAIIACRVWQWDETGLRSLNGEPWLAGRLLAAGCRAGAAGTWVHGATYKVTHTGHQAPAEDCSCGVYAAKSLSHLRWSGYDRYGIHGEVYLWGALVEHERGWRAQYAYPKSFVLPLEMMPVSVTILEARMAALAAYGCDVSVAGSKGIVPLWRKGSGYDAAGLALLIERCQDWYTRRAQKRRIKRGVRVAILGHGIAVVEQADEVQVTAVLWNQNRLRIGRKAIVWNEGNMRWEASQWDVCSTASGAGCLPS